MDDIINKASGGAPPTKGIKGIIPISGRFKPKKCVKTVSYRGRPRYICPASGGEAAIHSLENLPVKPEDTPRMLAQIKQFNPVEQFTPKKQREEPEKVKEALLRRPVSIHLQDAEEAGPDTVQDNLHFHSPKEATANESDAVILKDDKKGDKKNKKSSEDDMDKSLFKGVRVNKKTAAIKAPKAKSPKSKPIKAKPAKSPKSQPIKAKTARSAPSAKTTQSAPPVKSSTPASSVSKRSGGEHEASGAPKTFSSLKGAVGELGKKHQAAPETQYGGASESDLTTSHESGIRGLASGGFATPKGKSSFESLTAAKASLGADPGSSEDKSNVVESENWESFTKLNEGNTGELKYPGSFKLYQHGQVVKVSTNTPEFRGYVKQHFTREKMDRPSTFRGKKLEPRQVLSRYIKRGYVSPGPSVGAPDSSTRFSKDPATYAPKYTPKERAKEHKEDQADKLEKFSQNLEKKREATATFKKERQSRIDKFGHDPEDFKGKYTKQASGAEMASTVAEAAMWVIPLGTLAKVGVIGSKIPAVARLMAAVKGAGGTAKVTSGGLVVSGGSKFSNPMKTGLARVRDIASKAPKAPKAPPSSGGGAVALTRDTQLLDAFDKTAKILKPYALVSSAAAVAVGGSKLLDSSKDTATKATGAAATGVAATGAAAKARAAAKAKAKADAAVRTRTSSRPGKGRRTPWFDEDEDEDDDGVKIRPAKSDSDREGERLVIPGSDAKKKKGKAAVKAALKLAAEEQKDQVSEDRYSEIGDEKDIKEILDRAKATAKFSKSLAFIAPYVRQVRNKKISLKTALDRVPWHMQADLLAGIAKDKKRR